MSTRQHIADEPLVACHIDDNGASAVRQSKVGEAEVDRNSPLLLLLQPVSFLAGKSTDQCSLAVINMAGSADNRMSHLRRHFTKARSHSVPGSLVAAGLYFLPGPPQRQIVGRGSREKTRCSAFHLVVKHFHVEIVAPRLDLAVRGGFEYASDR